MASYRGYERQACPSLAFSGGGVLTPLFKSPFLLRKCPQTTSQKGNNSRCGGEAMSCWQLPGTAVTARVLFARQPRRCVSAAAGGSGVTGDASTQAETPGTLPPLSAPAAQTPGACGESPRPPLSCDHQALAQSLATPSSRCQRRAHGPGLASPSSLSSDH